MFALSVKGTATIVCLIELCFQVVSEDIALLGFVLFVQPASKATMNVSKVRFLNIVKDKAIPEISNILLYTCSINLELANDDFHNFNETCTCIGDYKDFIIIGTARYAEVGLALPSFL
jgi:hypothetical protein